MSLTMVLCFFLMVDLYRFRNKEHLCFTKRYNARGCAKAQWKQHPLKVGLDRHVLDRLSAYWRDASEPQSSCDFCFRIGLF